MPRAIVFSDSHGDYDVLERIMERHRENAELFIHLGDGERDICGIFILKRKFYSFAETATMQAKRRTMILQILRENAFFSPTAISMGSRAARSK